MTKISKTVGRYPQESHATVVRAILSEWTFLQLITRNKGYAFIGMEKLLRETFSPRLYLRKSKYLTPPHRNSKYDASQKILPRPPESCDICRRKISKLAMCKYGADSICDGGRQIIHCQSPYGSQVRKV